MSDISPDAPQLPSLAGHIVQGFAQKFLTTAATGLLAHGVLTQVQTTEFVEVGSALALYAAGSLWTVVSAYIRSKREKALLAASPATAKA